MIMGGVQVSDPAFSFGIAAAVVALCFELYLGCLTHLLKID